MLCQAYLQNQCAGNSRSERAHVCAMVARDSGHVFGTDIQHASIGGTSRQPSRGNSKESGPRWSHHSHWVAYQVDFAPRDVGTWAAETKEAGC